MHETFARVAGAPIHTTLSLFRTFQKWLDKNDLVLQGTREEKTRLVAQYMRSANIKDRNPVQNFHLSNGALVGAIQFGASRNTLDATDGAGVMINYRYARDPRRLAQNRELLEQGKIPCDRHLAPYFGS